MAAGQFWTPRTPSVVGRVEMLNLLQNVDVGVDESAYASMAPEPYIHLTPRVAARVVHDDARAIYIKTSGCRAPMKILIDNCWVSCTLKAGWFLLRNVDDPRPIKLIEAGGKKISAG